MSSFRKAFPSRFLQSSDLEDAPIVATIARIDSVNVAAANEPADMKLCARFTNTAVKPCVLNLTRCTAIAAIAASEDTSNWIGKTIRLSRGMTNFKGKAVACVVVDAPPLVGTVVGTATPSVRRPRGVSGPIDPRDPDSPMPGADEEPPL